LFALDLVGQLLSTTPPQSNKILITFIKCLTVFQYPLLGKLKFVFSHLLVIGRANNLLKLHSTSYLNPIFDV